MIQPPSSGPTMGAISTVIDQMPSALPARSGGWLASSRVCDSGIIGPATSPCRTRKATSHSSDGAMPHSHDASVNSSTLATNSRTCPKRAASQPVSGTEMAVAMPKPVITRVP